MDLELKKAFAELQTKMISTKQKLQIKDMQISQMTRVKQENDNTLKELDKLSADTVVYESVGRSFILTDIDQSKVHLNAENKNIDKNIQTCQKDKGILDRNLTQSQKNLRELVQQKKAAS